MKFVSTRGGVTGRSFSDSILSAYLLDGGILLPERIPRVPKEELSTWKSLSYRELCKKILPIFIDESEITGDEISEIVDKCFTEFEKPREVVTVQSLGHGVHIGELYHGPTGAFKDLALGLLGQFLDFVLSKRKRRVTILVGTSGDTGSAAIQSVRGSQWANLIVLYPLNRVSDIQRLQMTTVDAANVQVFGVDGTSDDLDVPIKMVFREAQFVEDYQLCSINSINVGRVLFQCVHYIFLYFQIHGSDLEQRLPCYIPTGAAGHITSGCIARQLTGLDFELIACVNENDIIHRWLETGVFKAAGEVVQTTSNAMDIMMPYNIERLLYLLSGSDTHLVRQLMGDLESSGSFVTPPALRATAAKFMRSHRVTEEERMDMIRQVYTDSKFILCPHTATGVCGALRDASSHSTRPCVCLATATAAKFPKAVEKAGVSETPTQPASWKSLYESTEKDKSMGSDENWEAVLRQAIVSAYGKNA